jgi:hypothetical protein
MLKTQTLLFYLLKMTLLRLKPVLLLLKRHSMLLIQLESLRERWPMLQILLRKRKHILTQHKRKLLKPLFRRL